MHDIGIVGGGINGMCTAWVLAQRGHRVTVYERDTIMGATSRASSKLLHGGLRYLETGSFRLVREALRERDAWLKRAPELTWPIRLTLPIYRTSRRPRWQVAIGLFLYDHVAGRTDLPKAKWLSAEQLIAHEPGLLADGLAGGYEFSDAQMDDHRLGLWVAEQAQRFGVTIVEHAEVLAVTPTGEVQLAHERRQYDRLINIAGPWAARLLEQSGIPSPIRLSLVRGSHLVLSRRTEHPYLLEMPGTHRIFFVLPWQGKTLVGTTEEVQDLDQPIECSDTERRDLLRAYQHYFPAERPEVVETFAGVRPLVHTTDDLTANSRDYVMRRDGRLLSVFGGKWTTALALASKVAGRVE